MMLLQWRQTIKRWGDRLRVRKCEEEEKMCGGSTHLEAGELCSLVFHRVLCIYRTKDTIYNTQSTHDATVHTT